MKKKLSALLLSLASITSLSAVALAKDDPMKGATAITSPFKGVCEDMVMISQHDYQMQKQYWDAVQANCNAQQARIDLPGEEFLSSMSEKLMTESGKGDNKAAADFLQKLGERARPGIEYNYKVTEVIEACANHQSSNALWFKGQIAQAKANAKKAEETKDASLAELAKLDLDLYDDSKCDERLDQLKKMIKDKGSEFRVNFEMARRTAAISNKLMSGMRGAADFVSGSGIAAESVPLTPEEKKQADKLEKDLNLRAEREVAKSTIDMRKKADAIAAFKAKEFDKFFASYSKALGDARILAFLDKRDPANEDIAHAAQALLKNGAEAKKEVDELLAAGAKPGLSDSQRAQKMLGLLRYGGTAADLLKEDRTNCRVAAALSNHVANADAKTQAMIGAGLLAGGLVAPWAVPPVLAAAGISVSAGAVAATAAAVTNAYAWGTVGQDYLAYQAAKARSFNYAHNVEGVSLGGHAVGDVDSVQEARNAFAANLAIQGAFAGVSAIPPAIRKYMDVQAAKPGQMIKALKATGVSDAEAKTLMAGVGSKDPAVAREAAEKIAKILGIEQGEVESFKKIVQKQLLDPNNRTYDIYASRMLQVSPERRQQVRQNFNEIMDLVKAGEISPQKSTDALRAALAASDFGVDANTAKQLASHMKNWDDKGSLYGLARALDKAAELRRAEPGLSHPEAFSRGLAQLGIKEQAVAKQMCECAGVCAAP